VRYLALLCSLAGCGSEALTEPDAVPRDLALAFEFPPAPDFATPTDLAAPPDLAPPRKTLSFAPPLQIANNELSHYMVAADLNNDKKTDLVLSLYPGDLGVMMGKGDGTFQPVVLYPTPVTPREPVVGDFSGDGHLDVLAASPEGAAVFEMVGKGDGTFLGVTVHAIAGDPISIAVGDFDKDGHADAAVACRQGNQIAIGLGGALSFGTVYPEGGAPWAARAADFDGDGHLDVAVGNFTDLNSVAVLRGLGTGFFVAKPVSSVVGSGVVSIAIADLDRDGKPDIVTANNTQDGEVSVALGKGDGSFAAAHTFTVGSGVFVVAVGDFDGDAFPDVVVGRSIGAAVLLGNGDGTLADAVPLDVGGAWAVAVADFNGDGLDDVAADDTSNGRISVFLNTSH
jgi:hypothetical protein